jgi:hypothetical protein
MLCCSLSNYLTYETCKEDGSLHAIIEEEGIFQDIFLDLQTFQLSGINLQSESKIHNKRPDTQASKCIRGSSPYIHFLTSALYPLLTHNFFSSPLFSPLLHPSPHPNPIPSPQPHTLSLLTHGPRSQRLKYRPRSTCALLERTAYAVEHSF